MQPLKYLDEMLPWNDRLQMLQCISAIEEAPDVMTFSFKTQDDNWFRYTPGQFITLELPIERSDGLGPVLRTYTLSSTPSRPCQISVTVKAQKDSIGTRWMLDNLRPPMTIKAYGPNGDFSLANHPSEKYLFISAGSGITPMVSMTRWLFEPSSIVHAHLMTSSSAKNWSFSPVAWKPCILLSLWNNHRRAMSGRVCMVASTAHGLNCWHPISCIAKYSAAALSHS